MMKILITVAMVLGLIFTLGCGLIDQALNKAVDSVAPSGGQAAELWPDVPPMEGLTKVDIELPLPVRLIIQAAMQQTMSEAGDKNGSMEFIAFNTSQTAKDVTDFYTIERMKEAGWNAPSAPGCAGNTANDQSKDAGSFCLFGKQEGNTANMLFVVITQGDKSDQTNVFYIRVVGDADKLNQGSSN
ncbi:MAG: hypothetical protein U0401_14250 [Anaerolineae bacterium]